MRRLYFVHLTAGLALAASAGAAQQWVVTRTKADIDAEIKGTQVSVALERPSIVAGEPLVLSVTIANETDAERMVCTDRSCLAWTIRSPSGIAVSAWTTAPHGDMAGPAALLAPHASTSFSVVAPDTAGIAAPGSYQVEAQYMDVGWAGHLGAAAEPRSFTVLPRNEAALAKRVRELSEAAMFPAAPSADVLAFQALAVIRHPVPESVLCDAINRNVLAAQYLVPRLEASGDAEAVGCLVDQLGKGGLNATVIIAALGRMTRTQADPTLRQRIEEGIAGACARATPDMPWMKGACSKP
ncbi:MAG: hypothetical protein WBL61_07955 [Bryobacteraceae bacterium]